MLERSQLKSMNPLFATPCYGGMVTQAFCNSILDLTHVSCQIGMDNAVLVGVGDSLVTRARNKIVAHFLANDKLTHLMWIDADIGFETESIFRLLLSDLDVVAGVYPLKGYSWPEDGLPQGMTQSEFEEAYSGFPVVLLPDAPIDADGFMEVRYAPTGFMMIKRDVLLKMVAHYPELRYDPGSTFRDSPEEQEIAKRFSYRLFDVLAEPNNGLYLSEDYAFCRRWSDMGGKIYVDVNIPLTHQGVTGYSGTLGKSSWLKMSRR